MWNARAMTIESSIDKTRMKLFFVVYLCQTASISSICPLTRPSYIYWTMKEVRILKGPNGLSPFSTFLLAELNVPSLELRCGRRELEFLPSIVGVHRTHFGAATQIGIGRDGAIELSRPIDRRWFLEASRQAQRLPADPGTMKALRV